MVAIGLVANARNAFPPMSEIDQLKPSYIRSIVYGNDDLEAALQDVPPRVRFIALMSKEHEEVGSDWSGWESAIQSFVYRFQGRVWGVELEREWDLNGDSAADIARLIETASPYLKDAGMKRIAGAVAGPDWQNKLTELWSIVNPWAYDFGNIHPYGQRVESMGSPQPGFGPGLAASIELASRLMGGKPIAVTEFGAKLRDYGGEDRQAQYVTEAFREVRTLPESVCPLACYFAWHDHVGSPDEQGDSAFGLVRANGSHRPAWYAYAALTSDTDPCEDRLARVRAITQRRPYKAPSKAKLLEAIA